MNAILAESAIIRAHDRMVRAAHYERFNPRVTLVDELVARRIYDAAHTTFHVLQMLYGKEV